MEELAQLDSGYDEGFDPHLVPHSQVLWGTNYFMDDPQCDVQLEKGLPVKNFFVDEISKKARYAMPFVRNIKYLMGSDACRPLIRSLGMEGVPPGVLTPDSPWVP